MSSNAPIPGWYPDPDPNTQNTVRWWDGNAWTHHTRERTQPPVPTSTAQPAFEPQAVEPQPLETQPAMSQVSEPQVAEPTEIPSSAPQHAHTGDTIDAYIPDTHHQSVFTAQPYSGGDVTNFTDAEIATREDDRAVDKQNDKQKQLLVGLLVVLLLTALYFTVLKNDSDSAQHPQQPQQTPTTQTAPAAATNAVAKCQKVQGPLIRSLTQSLQKVNTPKLSNVTSLEVVNPPKAPLPPFEGKVYLVSAILENPKTQLTWVVSQGMYQSGGGLAYSADAITAPYTQLGADVKQGAIKDYVAEIAAQQSYKTVRSCVQKV